MPSKKKKYNARFPAGRIKKIMQTDEEVGKVAQAVPVIISRTLELFVESLLTKAMQITSAKNAKTLSPSHMKQCILSEQRFDFLKDLVKSVQDNSNGEDDGMTAAVAVSTGTGLLTPAPHRSVSERRKSSSSSVKQEAIVVKEELMVKDVKQEATVVKEELVIKDEPVESPQFRENYSTLHLSQSLYSADRAAEPTASIHSPLAPSPPASPSPILVMDEDYDT